MSEQAEQHYQPVKAPLSGLGIFNALAQLLQETTNLQLASMNASDFERLSLLQLASEIAKSERHADRCQDDQVLCQIKVETSDYLKDMLKQLCFEVGETLYNMTSEFDKAVEDYNEAFQALTQELTRYRKTWTKLEDTFYQ